MEVAPKCNKQRYRDRELVRRACGRYFVNILEADLILNSPQTSPFLESLHSIPFHC